MKLYEIDQAIQEILDGAVVDEATGEVSMDLEALEALELQRQDKLEGVALAVKNISAEADAIRAEEKKLAARRKTLENKRDGLKDYLAYALNGEKLKTPRVAVSYRAGVESAKIDDIWTVVDWYLNIRTTLAPNPEEFDRIGELAHYTIPDPTFNLVGLKKLAKDYDIPGMHLEVGKPSLQIR